MSKKISIRILSIRFKKFHDQKCQKVFEWVYSVYDLKNFMTKNSQSFLVRILSIRFGKLHDQKLTKVFSFVYSVYQFRNCVVIMRPKCSSKSREQTASAPYGKLVEFHSHRFLTAPHSSWLLKDRVSSSSKQANRRTLHKKIDKTISLLEAKFLTHEISINLHQKSSNYKQRSGNRICLVDEMIIKNRCDAFGDSGRYPTIFFHNKRLPCWWKRAHRENLWPEFWMHEYSHQFPPFKKPSDYFWWFCLEQPGNVQMSIWLWFLIMSGKRGLQLLWDFRVACFKLDENRSLWTIKMSA